MDLPPTIPEDDVLAEPTRARLFAALAALRRPATTQELADRVGRHPNTSRLQLARLADAGLVERRQTPQRRGRPRHEWAIVPTARPAGQPPQAHAQLSQWLARATRKAQLDQVEKAGREIGRELLAGAQARPFAQAMRDVLTALGFAPALHAEANTVSYVLGNCPYREAVAQNQPVVCTLHRGITRGLLDRLDRSASLTEFVANDPYTAGCRIGVRLAGVAIGRPSVVEAG
jgi:predicted ArsR family transcriptional regulator